MIDKLLIGVIHLPRLPSTQYKGGLDVEDIIEGSIRESKLLEELGFGGIIVENFGDAPYLKRVRDPLTLAVIAVITREVVRSVNVDVGLNVLRNSGLEAYSVAVATGAKFIRVNSLSEVLITDSGIIEPEASRLRSVRFNYPGIKVYADIMCKHGGSLSYLAYKEQRLANEAENLLRELVLDIVERGRADAVIVTGPRTGIEPAVDQLAIVKEVSPVPVIVGSGVTPDNMSKLLKYADGVIVGSYIRVGGKAGNPVDVERARLFVRKFMEFK